MHQAVEPFKADPLQKRGRLPLSPGDKIEAGADADHCAFQARFVIRHPFLLPWTT
jgi:hypothetical protein